MENQEILDIIIVIEEASKISIHDIIDSEIQPWFDMWNEEIESLNK